MKNIIEAITGTKRGRALAFAWISIVATLVEADTLRTFWISESYRYPVKLLMAFVANAITALVVAAIYEYLLKKPKLKAFLKYALIVGVFGATYMGLGVILSYFFENNYFVNEVLVWPFIILVAPTVIITIPLAMLIQYSDFLLRVVNASLLSVHFAGWYFGIVASSMWSAIILLAIKMVQIIKAKRLSK